MLLNATRTESFCMTEKATTIVNNKIGTNFQGVARSTGGGWVGWLAGKGMQLGVMGRKLQAAIKCSRAWVTEHKS
jgi:hypothetical protein